MSLTVQVITVVYVLIMMCTIYHPFFFLIMMMQLFMVYHLYQLDNNEINIYKNVLCTAVYIK